MASSRNGLFVVRGNEGDGVLYLKVHLGVYGFSQKGLKEFVGGRKIKIETPQKHDFLCYRDMLIQLLRTAAEETSEQIKSSGIQAAFQFQALIRVGWEGNAADKIHIDSYDITDRHEGVYGLVDFIVDTVTDWLDEERCLSCFEDWSQEDNPRLDCEECPVTRWNSFREIADYLESKQFNDDYAIFNWHLNSQQDT